MGPWRPAARPSTYGDSEAALRERSQNLEMQFGSELVKIADDSLRRDVRQTAGLPRCPAPDCAPGVLHGTTLGYPHGCALRCDATHLVNRDQAYGDVDYCTSYVKRLLDAGADEVMFVVHMGTVPQEACLETIRNIGEHVLPRFR